MAVDKTRQRLGYSGLLLSDALKRCLSVSDQEIASLAVVVNPIDDYTRKLYQKFQFETISEMGQMMISMQTIRFCFLST